MREYEILPELRFDLYQKVLDFACAGACALGALAVPNDGADNHNVEEILGSLKPFMVVEEHDQLYWPANPHRGHVPLPGQVTASVYYFTLNADTVALLKDEVDRLYDWESEWRPEDLSLLREDKSPWLVSISHERMAWFHLTEIEHANLLAAIPEMAELIRRTPRQGPTKA